VRPEHFRISPQGHATLIDLSLARRLESGECAAAPFGPDNAVYAAPETFSHQTCTAASDTYSLGIVLFEMLTGQLPFVAANPLELALLHRRHPPPAIRSLIPHASLELNELVRRMLAKQPLRRPSDEELVRWLAEVEIAELAR
jgi:eukaryotic-like serine/threonine-protein kinase